MFEKQLIPVGLPRQGTDNRRTHFVRDLLARQKKDKQGDRCGRTVPGSREQMPRVRIRANDWQCFCSAGHGVPRDAASWIGRRKIYPHTRSTTTHHTAATPPFTSQTYLRRNSTPRLQPPHATKQLDVRYGKNHPPHRLCRSDDATRQEKPATATKPDITTSMNI